MTGLQPVWLAPVWTLWKASQIMRASNVLKIVFSLIILSACPMNVQSATTDMQTSNSFHRIFTVEQHLDYLQFLPKGYDPDRAEGWPLILFLHGAGERGADLQRVKWHGPTQFVEQHPDFPFILISPQCPDGLIWDDASLLGLLDEVIALHNVDTNRVYLTGLSMGGFGTWSLGLSHPERFAAIAPICGGGAPIRLRLADKQKQKAVVKLPVWAFHGAKDPVVPLEESERMVSAIKALGGSEVKLTVYPEANHDSWTETYRNPGLFEWFLEQQR